MKLRPSLATLSQRCVVDISGSMRLIASYEEDDGTVRDDGLTVLDVVKHAVKTVRRAPRRSCSSSSPSRADADARARAPRARAARARA